MKAIDKIRKNEGFIILSSLNNEYGISLYLLRSSLISLNNVIGSVTRVYISLIWIIPTQLLGFDTVNDN